MNKLLLITAAILASTNALALDIVSCKALNDSASSIEVTYLNDHSENQSITLQVGQSKTTSLGVVQIVKSSKPGFYDVIKVRDESVIGQCPTALSLRIERDASDAKDKSDQ